MNFTIAKITGNTVDLCASCEKDWESCDSKEGEFVFGDGKNNICCCAKYYPLKTREEEEA